MKIVIDDKVCLKYKLTLDEFLIALTLKKVNSHSAVLKNMLNRGILVLKDGKYCITKPWEDKINEIIAASLGEQDEERLKNLAIEMRKVYPEGRMIDRKTGQPTAYYFRCNVTEVSRKLKTFFARYGNYSDEDIIDATKRYVASYNSNYQQKGFRILKYFILKDDVKQGPDGNYVEPMSPLLDFLENKENEENVVTNNDWTTKMI